MVSSSPGACIMVLTMTFSPFSSFFLHSQQTPYAPLPTIRMNSYSSSLDLVAIWKETNVSGDHDKGYYNRRSAEKPIVVSNYGRTEGMDWNGAAIHGMLSITIWENLWSITKRCLLKVFSAMLSGKINESSLKKEDRWRGSACKESHQEQVSLPTFRSEKDSTYITWNGSNQLVNSFSYARRGSPRQTDKPAPKQSARRLVRELLIIYDITFLHMKLSCWWSVHPIPFFNMLCFELLVELSIWF